MRELGPLNVTANRPTRLTTQWAWEDGDEDDYSEKNDDYDFDNQSTGTAQRHR